MRAVSEEVYIEDRPHIWKNSNGHISARRVIRSTSCLVLQWGFWGRQIEWCYLRCDQIQ